MERCKILSGDQIVAKGITKFDASFPEIGLKDVAPNGSWLEQKQVQAALEARKHLIEVERIEKCGNLSHAEWREDLNLAEVTQMTGGHWQYLGHHIDKKLYLKPEEALFLIEVNCLLLKHNDVIVSLQKAYSLLLKDTRSALQYKVYASLSRLGYKVFQHNSSMKYKVKDVLTLSTQKSIINNSSVIINASEVNGESNQCEFKDNDLSVKTVDNNVNQGVTDTVYNEDMSVSKDRRETSQCTRKSIDIVAYEDCMSFENSNTITVTSETTTITAEDEKKVKTKLIIESVMDTDIERCEDINTETQFRQNESEVNAVSQQQNKLDVNSAVDIVSENNQMQSHYSENNRDSTSTGCPQKENSNNANIIGNLIDTMKSDNNNTVQDFKEDKQAYYYLKLKKLRSRNLKPTNINTLNKHFENIPDLYQKQIVTVNVPIQDHIPQNVFVNKSSYVLNLLNITSRKSRSTSSESSNYSVTDEVNDSRMRRIRNTSNAETSQSIPGPRFVRHSHSYRPYNLWRPHNTANYYQFGMFFQRPCTQNMYFLPRFQYHQRTNPFIRPFSHQSSMNCDTNPGRKRGRTNLKSSQMRGIKVLAARLKSLIMSGNTQIQNVQSLQSLLHTYNMKYRTRLRLTEHFDVINDETIVETIELDDDEESTSKRRRVGGQDKFEENLNRLRQLALKLKDLEIKNKAVARHRRAFSNAVKTFNKSYKSDVYLNSNYQIIDRSHITLDSSPESDCILENSLSNKEKVRKKKLRNPFNILKRLSEKDRLDISDVPTCSTDNFLELERKKKPEQNMSYSKQTKQTFNENWLPNENDFGRAEVVLLNTTARQADCYKEAYIFEFIKDQPERYQNWLDVKLSFYKYINEATVAYKKHQTQLQNEADEVFSSGLKPLLFANFDCLEVPSVLQELSIIQNNKEISNEAVLRIHFDVYNRDVQHFKKTNPPKPHFRIICIDESADFPSAAEISALCDMYDQTIPVVFSIVGIGSISYLQINPIDLPVYVTNNDMV